MTSIGGLRVVFENIAPLLGRRCHKTPETQRLEEITEFVAAERGLLYKFFPPRKLHHFMEVERKLGEGGFGAVYEARATERGLQRIPALKEGRRYAVKRTSLTDPEPFDLSLLRLSKERMLQLVDTVASPECEHAHIVRIHAMLVECPRYWYEVLELLEGPDLFDFISVRNRTVPEAQAAQITRQMTSAMHYLHREAGVLHRDIKPENFAFLRPLSSDADLPPLKMFDFGVSWALLEPVTEETSRTLFEVPPAGTPRYCSPEAWQGRCGAPLDVWSAGIIVYIMLCLDLPYNLAGGRKPRRALERNSLEFPESRWAGTSTAARELVASMLQKEVEARASTAEVLASSWLASPGEGPALERSVTSPPLGQKTGTAWRSLICHQAAGATEPNIASSDDDGDDPA